MMRISLIGTVLIIVGLFISVAWSWSGIEGVFALVVFGAPMAFQAWVLASASRPGAVINRVALLIAVVWCIFSSGFLSVSSLLMYLNHGYIGWTRDGIELTSTAGLGVTAEDMLMNGLVIPVQVTTVIALWRMSRRLPNTYQPSRGQVKRSSPSGRRSKKARDRKK
jgi:hypothetical protein